MTGPTRKAVTVILAAALSEPCAAAPIISADVVISSATATPRGAAPLFQPRFDKADAPGGRAFVGIGLRLDEGKPLQAGLWGGTGAVIGSLAGPLGAAVGGGAGVLLGLLFGKSRPKTARRDAFRLQGEQAAHGAEGGGERAREAPARGARPL